MNRKWRYVTLILLILLKLNYTYGCGYVPPDPSEITEGGVTVVYGSDPVKNSSFRTKRDVVNGSRSWVPMVIATEYNEEDLKDVDKDIVRDLRLMIFETVEYFRKTLRILTDQAATSIRFRNFCSDQGERTFPFSDYALLVRYKPCDGDNTVLASARHCDISDMFGLKRPTSGTTTICRNQFESRQPQQEQMWIATLKHELMHALVFSVALFPEFTGAPPYLRPKPHNLVEIPGVVKKIRRTWKLASGDIDHDVFLITTPKVTEAVREHFNCPDLEGAELENQGAEGTAGSHWEKRVFEHEAMSGMSTQIYAISNVTLALFEDSGWYQVNYSMAEPMDWGKNAGCDFVKESCLSYTMKNPKDPWPFCVDSEKRCSRDRRSKMKCIIADTRYEKEYNYFDPKQKHGPIGPGIQLADYCLYYKEYSNSNKNGTDSRCTYRDNMVRWDAGLEVFSETARCFSTSFIAQRRGLEIITHYVNNGCFETKCSDQKLWIKTQHSKFYPCHKEGQLIYVAKNHKLSEDQMEYISFNITCPKCSELCSDCVETEPPEEIVGDVEFLRKSSTIPAILPTILAMILY